MSRKKKTSINIKIDTTEIMLKRAGKANKGMPEVSRGCGRHTPKMHKKKHKDHWKRDTKQYLG